MGAWKGGKKGRRRLPFLGDDDMLVLEKASGRVQRIVGGTIHSTVLDLAVNSNSDRGLLGIALDQRFRVNGYVYLYWTESTTGADTTAATDVPLLGNRVDRFVWNGSTLTFDGNLIRLRAFQADADCTATTTAVDGPFGPRHP